MNEPFTIRDGAGLAAGAVALHFMTAGMAARLHAPTFVTEMTGIATMAGVVLYAARHALVDRLAIRRPQLRFVVAAVLFGLAAPEVMAWVQHPITTWLGPSLAWKHNAERVVLWQSLVWIAICGPITEELVFRGVLVRSLATKWPAWRAVLVAAFLFALYHSSPHQFVGPLCFGAMTGWLVLRSSSIVPGIIAHICNNLQTTLLDYDLPAGLWRALEAHADTFRVSCALACFTAIWIVRRG